MNIDTLIRKSINLSRRGEVFCDTFLAILDVVFNSISYIIYGRKMSLGSNLALNSRSRESVILYISIRLGMRLPRIIPDSLQMGTPEYLEKADQRPLS